MSSGVQDIPGNDLNITEEKCTVKGHFKDHGVDFRQIILILDLRMYNMKDVETMQENSANYELHNSLFSIKYNLFFFGNVFK